MLKTFTLKNGLKIATYSIPQMRSVRLSISVKGGSIFDTSKTSGVAHFMEHMLVQGIPSLPTVEAFSDYIEGLAGSYGAYTAREHINFSMSVPQTHLEEALRISSEVMFEPLLPSDALERERNAVFEEIKERQNETWYKNSRFFNQVRFQGEHPLHLDPGGSIESVGQLTRDDLSSYYNEFFFPANTYLVLVGAVKEAEELIKKYFGKHKSDKKFTGYKKVEQDTMSERCVAIREDNDFKSTFVDFSFPTIDNSVGWQGQLPGILVRYILGYLRRSRLHRLLRQQRGLVYSVGYGTFLLQELGYSYVSTQVSIENLDEVVELISKELENFYRFGPDEKELEFAKNYFTNSTLMTFDHPSAIANWIEDDLLWEGEVFSPEDYKKETQKVKAEDLLEFMKKYWDLKRLNLTIQGPIKNSGSSIKKFESKMGDLWQG